MNFNIQANTKIFRKFSFIFLNQFYVEVSLLTEVADLSLLRIFLSFALLGMLCDEKDSETSVPDSSFFLLETILTSKENLLREKTYPGRSTRFDKINSKEAISM